MKRPGLWEAPVFTAVLHGDPRKNETISCPEAYLRTQILALEIVKTFAGVLVPSCQVLQKIFLESIISVVARHRC